MIQELYHCTTAGGHKDFVFEFQSSKLNWIVEPKVIFVSRANPYEHFRFI
jgi:hypothetical protein